MESSEHQLIMSMIHKDIRLKRLYEQHREFEEKLVKFQNKRFLTAFEEMEQKQLKKEKLHGVDKIMAILEQHRMAA
jgi:hypothetical protein